MGQRAKCAGHACDRRKYAALMNRYRNQSAAIKCGDWCARRHVNYAGVSVAQQTVLDFLVVREFTMRLSPELSHSDADLVVRHQSGGGASGSGERTRIQIGYGIRRHNADSVEYDIVL